MEAEAKAFELERKNNPEENDDHDTRKLPKPERMRLVAKNKDASIFFVYVSLVPIELPLYHLRISLMGTFACRPLEGATI